MTKTMDRLTRKYVVTYLNTNKERLDNIELNELKVILYYLDHKSEVA